MSYKHALQVAEHYIGLRELHGNRGNDIDRWNKLCHAPVGSPWCSSFATAGAFHEYAMQPGANPAGLVDMPLLAGSQSLLAWFKKKGWTSTDPQDLLKMRGALIIRTNPDRLHGHVAIVKARMTHNGTIEAIKTVEGNTNNDGSANGIGVFELKRKIPLKPYTWTICDTTKINGGAWWPTPK